MDKIGVLPPEQMRLLWQDYMERKQLPAQLQKNFPQRRPLDEPSPHRVFVLNSVSYETIPPYACMQVTGTAEYGGQTVVTVEKPFSLDGVYLFNGQFPIDIGASGWAYRFGVVVMLGNPPSEAGASYQPTLDEWTIEEGSGPFVVYGSHNAADNGLIGTFAGSSGSGAPRIWFVIDEVECFSDGSKVLQVYPTWYTGGCTTAIPGEDSYGRVEITDVCSTLYPYTAEQLLDATGSATRMYPRSGYCEPKWIVDDICVIPDCA